MWIFRRWDLDGKHLKSGEREPPTVALVPGGLHPELGAEQNSKQSVREDRNGPMKTFLSGLRLWCFPWWAPLKN